MGAKPPRMKGGLLGNSQFCDRFSYVFGGFSFISPPIYPTQNSLFPSRSRLDCWRRGGGVLVQQVLICEGNKPQIQSNHIIIYRKNLFFLLKAGPGLKCKFTEINPNFLYSGCISSNSLARKPGIILVKLTTVSREF